MMNRARKRLALCLMVTVLMPLTAWAGDKDKHETNHPQESRKAPKKKRAHLDTKGAVRGSGFRISWIHPMRGNFAEYDTLEIVNLTSAIGDRVPAEEMEKYTEDLVRSFEEASIFGEVRKVDEATLAERPAESVNSEATEAAVMASPQGTLSSLDDQIAFLSSPFHSSSLPVIPGDSVPHRLETPLQVIAPDAPLPPETAPAPRSPLEAPLELMDPASLPQESEALAVTQAPEPKRTMVITGEVIYYKKGNRGLRIVGLGLGYHRFVVRFHIYDKELGEELAMGNISGEVMEGFLSVPGLVGDADGRKQVVDALVNRVERRRAQANQ